MTKYILGGGISGLIFKHFNPEYEIISPDLGGQLKKHKNITITFYIHNTKETKKLLDDLNIKYKEKRLRIYYNYMGQILDNINTDRRKNFVINKMIEFDSEDNNYFNIEDTNLSTNHNYLDILDCDINELVKKLEPKSKIDGEVKLINSDKKFLIYKNKNKLIKINYDKLVSTIPANLFFNLLYNYNNKYHLNYLPTTFILSKKKPAFMNDDGLYYVLDDKLIYNRVQPYENNYIYEITGLLTEDEIYKYFNKDDIVMKEQRYMGIIKSEEILDFKNIKFLGRFAQWNHKIKVQDVIKKSINIKNEN